MLDFHFLLFYRFIANCFYKMHFTNYSALAIVGIVFACVVGAYDEVEPPPEEPVSQSGDNSQNNSIIIGIYLQRAV